MQTLLTSSQMREADAATLRIKEISSIQLMENAATAFVKVFVKEFPDHHTKISVICGQGNNGGDALAIARLLKNSKYKNIQVFLIKFSENEMQDYVINLKKLKHKKIAIIDVIAVDQIKGIQTDVVIDGVLGSGLNKPLSGNYKKLAMYINQLDAKIVAIDIPTGFNGEEIIAEDYKGVKADLVISFQRPKINFFFPESVKALNRFKIVDIGLDETFIQEQNSPWKLITSFDAENLIKKRVNFTHKGTYGHALIVAGNTTTMGAALLAAGACLHAGAGLTTVCLPESGLTALNTTLPEVMALIRNNSLKVDDFEKFNSIAIGPGFGIEKNNEELVEKIINLQKPLIIDADALTILSRRIDLLNKIPAQSILTPHMKEFDRLFGEHKTWWERILTARKKAKELALIIVLKNQYTFICSPSGDVYINTSGNPSMASGGMGDTLTGIIAALIAQNYTAEEAAILGIYIHGKAGDELAKKKFIVTASKLATQIAKSMKKIALKKK